MFSSGPYETGMFRMSYTGMYLQRVLAENAHRSDPLSERAIGVSREKASTPLTLVEK